MLRSKIPKNLNNLGVSPVIGIILMVAVSVTLVALSTTLVFDITGNINEPSTGSSVNIQPQQQSDNILVSVNRNPDLERVFVRGDGINGEQEIVNSVGETGRVSISPSSTEGTVEVVGETEDGSEQVLETEEYKDYSGTGSSSMDSTDTVDEPFIIKIDSTESGNTGSTEFKINTSDNYNYKYNVSTDGTIVNPESELNNVTGDLTLEFSSKGVYEIKIDGKMPHLYYYDFGNDANKITSIEQWGSIQWKNMSGMFYGATNLDSYNAQDDPDLSNVKNMSFMFGGAEDFNGDIGDWDTSNVRNMSGMLGTSTFFTDTMSFNQDISSWDTSNVRNMSYMFLYAHSFNQDISSWDMSNVRNMHQMFRNAVSFNQDISGWDTGNVQNMSGMFDGADNYNNGGKALDWTATQNLRNTSQMFRDTDVFNQDISSWDTSNVRNMSDMFARADNYNNGGESLDWTATQNLKYTIRMFADADGFNQDISSWDTSNLQDSHEMFSRATRFNNGGVTLDWETGNIQDSRYMFASADSFNQDISSWDTSSITRMKNMFYDADSFNQDISSWCVSQISSEPGEFDTNTPIDGTSKVPTWDSSDGC